MDKTDAEWWFDRGRIFGYIEANADEGFAREQSILDGDHGLDFESQWNAAQGGPHEKSPDLPR